MEQSCSQATFLIVCQNVDCPNKGVIGPHIRRYGKTRKGIQRYQCKSCKSTFTQTRGSFFYNLHTPPDTILECLALIAQSQKLSLIRRLKGVKEDTLVAWMRQATEHIEEVETLLEQNFDINQTQLQQFWAHADRYR